MSSSDRNGRRALLLMAFATIVLTPLPGQNISRQAALTCPATIKVTESAAGTGAWKGSSVTTEHSFERISIYNGKDGDKEYDLAPDDEKERGSKITQTWDLKAYRSMNILMRCRYRDTAAVLSMDLPAALKTCTFTFEMDAKGRIVGKPAAVCR